MRTGIANLPLHYGRAPRWLFERMVRLSRAIIESLIIEHGADVFLERISDPFWFQAFGSVLGFDWHSSGLTTTVCGAMKEGMKDAGRSYGIYFCGGKGATSRRTPQEIEMISQAVGTDAPRLIYASKTAAKVDSTCVQDGYDLYHHMFIFTRHNGWAVIQQGLCVQNRRARRYHWLSHSMRSFVNEPHAAVCCDQTSSSLNLVAQESEACRLSIPAVVRQTPSAILAAADKALVMPQRHPILTEDINSRYLRQVLLKTYEAAPIDFEGLLQVKGVGAKTVRALALIAELLYGAVPSFRDPARFAFAHGGKDGFPYPVDRSRYDQSIDYLDRAIKKAKIGDNDKYRALKRLRNL